MTKGVYTMGVRSACAVVVVSIMHVLSTGGMICLWRTGVATQRARFACGLAADTG
jgi:hypothetical protein